MKRKLIYTVLLLLLLAGGFVGWKLLGPATAAPERKYFYVRTGASYQDVKKDLVFLKIIPGEFWFDQVSKKLDYDKSVKAGRYEVKNGMSLLSLVRMLRSGNQSPVNFVINKLRTKEDLAARVGASFECDSLDFIHFINNPDSIKRYRLDSNTVMTAVIPNTYSLFWNSTPSRIFRKLANEQEKFWNEEREKKAAALGMTPA
ncbi:MAG: endolytic transglycosylase MltG, partial [Ferruginibacter sp.]